jgi:hypothetical protein
MMRSMSNLLAARITLIEKRARRYDEHAVAPDVSEISAEIDRAARELQQAVTSRQFQAGKAWRGRW